jgi:hypothetical protein
MRLKHIIFFVLLFWATSAFSATHYVSTTGSASMTVYFLQVVFVLFHNEALGKMQTFI